MLDVAARGVAREREADEILAACFRRVAGLKDLESTRRLDWGRALKT